ncbi:hypothetical protein [Rufibacter ruber]|uniref:hypothetical protein n=1 Tax=Rufibacter ruber TaxID=1783499 RepID=UPI000AC58F80|nr:hypothetical protein [Rufibacter ruber]
MKKPLLLLPFFLLTGSFFCKAQSLPTPNGSPRPRMSLRIVGVRASAHPEPLLLIGAQETVLSALIVHPKDLAIKEIYRNSTLLASVEGQGKNGILVGELKSKRPLFRLEHVLEYFQVPHEKRSLRVLVNKQPVDPTLFLADVQQIEKIEVTRQELTNPVRLSWNENEEYLNIVTAQ